jgi:hypothetical protein
MSTGFGKSNGDDMFSPQCNRCSNYLKNGKCMAFLNRIPDEILDGEHDHTKPFPGDNGIRFEPIED